MTKTSHQCWAQGHLVSAEFWLPTDPGDFHWGLAQPMIGCNNLVCGSCGGHVRQTPGLTVKPRQRVEAQQLWQTPDWTLLDALEAHSIGRIYACACQVFVEMTSDAVTPAGGWQSMSDLRTSWRCAGHPAVALPGALDGVELTAKLDVEPLVKGLARNTLFDTAPWPETHIPADTEPAFWLARLFARLSDNTSRKRLGRGVQPHLTAEDPAERLIAVDFYRQHPLATGSNAISHVFEDHRELYRGVPDPLGRSDDLDHNLILALEQQVALTYKNGKPRNPHAIQVAQRELLRGGAQVTHLLFYLGAQSPAWLASHAGDIVRLHPDLLEHTLIAMRTHTVDLQVKAALNLAEHNVMSEEALRETLAEAYWQDGRDAALAALDQRD